MPENTVKTPPTIEPVLAQPPQSANPNPGLSAGGLATPPPSAAPEGSPQPHAPPISDFSSQKPLEIAKQKPPKAPKAVSGNSSSGVGAAIFATVIIVLGLAALAVYAYVKTKK